MICCLYAKSGHSIETVKKFVIFFKTNNQDNKSSYSKSLTRNDEVNCRVQIVSNREYSFAGRRDILSSLRGETLKNDGAAPASLSFIYNPHFIIIRPHTHRTRWGYPFQISRGRVTNDWRRRRHRKKKKLFCSTGERAERRCVCRSGPGNRS